MSESRRLAHTPRGDRLLAYIEVHRPWQIARLVLVAQPLLGAPDQQHLLVQAHQILMRNSRFRPRHGQFPPQ